MKSQFFYLTHYCYQINILYKFFFYFFYTLIENNIKFLHILKYIHFQMIIFVVNKYTSEWYINAIFFIK